MKKRIYSITLLLCMLFTTFFGCINVSAAEDKQYSDVLTDLQKDPNFNKDNYPYTVDENDTSIKIIQIAESVDKELFLYIYHPAYYLDLKVNQVAMWDNFSNNGKNFTPILYDLEFINSNGVFYKYRVKNYTVSDEIYRYYNISAIYRPYNASIDKSITEGTTDSIAIGVGQQWCAYWFNDQITYEMNTFNVVEITPIFNGEIEFRDGVLLNYLVSSAWGGVSGSGILHFIAFDVDNYIVEKIYDADLSCNSRTYETVHPIIGDSYTTYGEWTGEKTIFLSEGGKGSYTGEGVNDRTYKWNEITSAKEFRKNLENQGLVLSDTSKKALDNAEWVFAFAATEKTTFDSLSKTTIKGTEMTDVTILRLHFQDPQGVWNLGVVMDKTTSDGIPDGIGNSAKDPFELPEWLKELIEKILLVLGIVVIVLVVIALFPIISTVFKGIFFVLKVIVSVITFPFRLLFRRRR